MFEHCGSRRPRMAKMRPRMAKTRPKMAKTRPKMAKMKPKMRPNMRPRRAQERFQILWAPTRNTGFCATGRFKGHFDPCEN